MAEMNELIDEIKEDIRLDQLVKFWKKYANFIIAGLVAIILVTAGSVFWEHLKNQKNLKYAGLYEKALHAADAKHPEKANEILSLLKDKHDGYTVLAAFKKSHLTNTKQEDRFKVYLDLAANKQIEAKFRELAIILWGYEGFENLDHDALAKKIEPIANGASVWRDSAIELLGLLAIRQNNLKRAAELFKLLLEDKYAPPSIKSRAMAYLEQIGVLN
jgi:hypothetical protein